MSEKRVGYLKYVRFFVILLLTAIVLPAMGYEDRGRRQRDDERPRRADNPRRAEMQQEAQESFRLIDDLLKQVLGFANKNERPDAALIEKAQTALQENKQFALGYEETQKGAYMLLQAWCGFYEGDLTEANRWSTRACKQDPANQDIWVSQALFSLLAGQRPLEQRSSMGPRPRSQEQDREGRRRGRENNAENGMQTTPQYGETQGSNLQKGVLDYDLFLLNSAVLQDRYERLDYVPVNGPKMNYVPGAGTICMFFWQSELISDPNDTTGGRRETKKDEKSFAEIAGQAGLEQVSLENQKPFFEGLHRACRDNDQIQFVQINTDKPDTAKKLKSELSVDEIGDLPQVFSADAKSGAGQFMGTDARVPFMVVVGKDGKVKYAGVAKGFFPAMVISYLTDKEIPLDSLGQSQTLGQPWNNNPRDVILPPGMPVSRRDPNKPTMDPNVPIIDPNMLMTDPNVPIKPKAVQPVVVKPRPAVKPKPAPEETVQYRQLPMEEDIQAQKELSGADTFMKLARKRGLTYKRGVEMCRAIIKRYPGTQYEHDARELLKQVPEHKRGTYQITDEELGL